MYDKSERLECPICHYQFQTLSRHLKLTHKLTDEDIRTRYPGMKLRTDTFQSRVSEDLAKARDNNWKDPEFRTRKSESARKSMYNNILSKPEVHLRGCKLGAAARLKHAEEDPDWWRDLQKRAGNSRRGRKRPDTSEWLKEKWKDPEYREKQSNRFREMVKSIWSDPQKVKEAGYGYYTHTCIEYNGNKYRSSWEVYFAKFCEKFNLEYEYENYSIKYMIDSKSHSYIPDFYLPQFDLYIEIHPYKLMSSSFLDKIDYCLNLGYNILLLDEALLFSEYDELLELIKSSTTIEN